MDVATVVISNRDLKCFFSGLRWSLPIIKCYLCSEFSADAFHFESEVLNKTTSPALNKN